MISSFRDKYGFLSNFYPSPVFDYPTVEHYYQAQKTLDPIEREKIRKVDTAGKAKRLGKTVKLRSDWKQVSLKVMKDALREKFKNPRLASLLLSTGREELVEGNYWHDNFWGSCNCPRCKNKDGLNLLGKLLMEVRKELLLSIR